LFLLFSTFALSNSVGVCAFTLSEYCTCRGVERKSPWGYVGKTSIFTTGNTMAYVWAKLLNVDRSHNVIFRWVMIDDNGKQSLMQSNTWNTTDPRSQGYARYSWYVLWECTVIESASSVGKWEVSLLVDNESMFKLPFTVSRDPSSITVTETTLTRLTQTYTTTLTITAAGYAAVVSTPTILGISVAFGTLVAFLSFRHLRRKRKISRPISETDDVPAFLARIEELRLRGEMTEQTYEKLKKEYWERIEKRMTSQSQETNK